MIDATGAANSAQLLVDIPETLRLLGNMAQRSYQRMRSSGKFAPKAIKIGGRIYHRPDELKAWVNAGCPGIGRWKWEAN